MCLRLSDGYHGDVVHCRIMLNFFGLCLSLLTFLFPSAQGVDGMEQTETFPFLGNLTEAIVKSPPFSYSLDSFHDSLS